MANLPNEILDHIFELACTDDGKTGRALSLVSARINAVSLRHKYFSVRVVGTERLAKFSSFLQDFKQSLPTSIQYLTLDYTPVEAHATGVLKGDRSEGSKVEPLYSNMPPTQTTFIDEESVRQTSNIIFSILAPTLRGLYLIHNILSLDLNLEPDLFTFSQLDTLYMYGNFSVTLTQASFPSLKRLEASCIRASGPDSKVWGYGLLLDRINIPTLTHFGCCIHSLDARQMKTLEPFMFGSYVIPAYHNLSLKSNKLLQLGTLRLWLLSNLRTLSEMARGLEGLPEKFPRVVICNHERKIGDIVPIEEQWCYIVEGGEGFKT